MTFYFANLKDPRSLHTHFRIVDKILDKHASSGLNLEHNKVG